MEFAPATITISFDVDDHERIKSIVNLLSTVYLNGSYESTLYQIYELARCAVKHGNDNVDELTQTLEQIKRLSFTE